MTLEKELEIAKQAAEQAGRRIREIYTSDIDIHVEFKQGDEQPVTIADKAANRIICTVLHRAFPEFGILTEEAIRREDFGEEYASLEQAMTQWQERDFCWIIDPLDGTRGFIGKTGDFGVHIGLLYQGNPILGVNYYPLQDTFYFAVKGEGAYKQTQDGIEQLAVSDIVDIETMRLLISRTRMHDDVTKFLDDGHIKNIIKKGSAGSKICAIAEGQGDVFMRLKSCMGLWDVCSSHVIVQEAGGRITDSYGNPITYRQQNTSLSNGLIVSNGKNHQRLVELVKDYVLI